MASIYEYYTPGSPEETSKLCASLKNPRILAGGTDLLLRIRSSADGDISLVSLKKIDILKKIELRNDSTMFIGSMILLDTIEHDAFLKKQFPALATAAAAIGSPSIRNTATLGGNICNASPSADLAPALLVYDARAVVFKDGKEEEIALSKFFTGPGATDLAKTDVLMGVILPMPDTGARSAFLKQGRGRGMDVATVNAAACLTVSKGICTRARVALGAVAPTPFSVTVAEAVLEGSALKNRERVVEEAAEAAAAAVRPIDDVRSSAQYRRHISKILVTRLLKTLLSEGSEGGVQ